MQYLSIVPPRPYFVNLILAKGNETYYQTSHPTLIKKLNCASYILRALRALCGSSTSVGALSKRALCVRGFQPRPLD